MPPDASDVTDFAGPWPAGQDVVAVGGSLEPDLVFSAYRHGVFPFHGERQPVLWWCPDPRAVLPLDALHVPRRLARTLRGGGWSLSVDTAFEAVMRGCCEGREADAWIHERMIACYVALHRRGHAHSLEVRRGGRLVGGIYGVAVGGCFAAESKFHRERDASKVAFVTLVRHLVERGFALLDVQFLTDHLAQFGVREIPRDDYLARLAELRSRSVAFGEELVVPPGP